jgi:hypothetical protein
MFAVLMSCPGVFAASSAEPEERLPEKRCEDAGRRVVSFGFLWQTVSVQ